MEKRVVLLCAGADRERARPILDALRAKGFRFAAKGERAVPVLLLLSAAFAADESAQEAFFTADGERREIIPIDLDGAAQSELVRSALMARNAIMAQGRTPEEVAARVAAAAVFARKEAPGWIAPVLIVAVLLLVEAAVIRLFPVKTPESAAAAVPALTLERPGSDNVNISEVSQALLIGDKLYLYTHEERQNDHSVEDMYSYVTEDWDDGLHLYSTEDGHEIALTHYDDLSILALMPKLQDLTLIGVEAEGLPSLSGLVGLEYVKLFNCRFGGYDWLADTAVRGVALIWCDITDLSVLNSCEKLSELVLTPSEKQDADLSHFAPPALERLEMDLIQLENRTPELSALSGCEKLRELHLKGSGLRDLDFLAGLEALESLTLEEMSALRDVSALSGCTSLEALKIANCQVINISALEELHKLKELTIENCMFIQSFQPIGGCTALRSLRITDTNRLYDTSFLASLTELEDIVLHGAGIGVQNLDFLYALPEEREISLELSGPIRDYSALAHIRRFSYLHVNPDNGKAAAVLPYLSGATVGTLCLYECNGLDLSLLPQVTGRLEIRRGDLRDLSGLPALETNELELWDLQNLTSLDGIEAMQAFAEGEKGLVLDISECPKLSDWSALENRALMHLALRGVSSLPPLESIDFSSLELEGIAGVKDLSFLATKPDGWHYHHISLQDMGDLRDITQLRRLRGEYVAVQPQLAEQAEELAALGAVESFEILYPEGEWQPDERDVTLTSLDELETLPRSMLRCVRELCLAGERVIDTGSYELTERKGALVLRERKSGKETALVPEGSLSALPDLSALTGLRSLSLISEGLKSLDGVQYLGALESVELRDCAALSDVSALFALQELRRVALVGCPVASLQGVQNLTQLEELDLRGTAVTDLRPLWGMGRLRLVRISKDMEAAAASLAGQIYGFELKIEG